MARRARGRRRGRVRRRAQRRWPAGGRGGERGEKARLSREYAEPMDYVCSVSCTVGPHSRATLSHSRAYTVGVFASPFPSCRSSLPFATIHHLCWSGRRQCSWERPSRPYHRGSQRLWWMQSKRGRRMTCRSRRATTSAFASAMLDATVSADPSESIILISSISIVRGRGCKKSLQPKVHEGFSAWYNHCRRVPEMHSISSTVSHCLSQI